MTRKLLDSTAIAGRKSKAELAAMKEQELAEVKTRRLELQPERSLEDNYGARHVRVKEHDKVYTYLMFGVIAITVKQLFNMLN